MFSFRITWGHRFGNLLHNYKRHFCVKCQKLHELLTPIFEDNKWINQHGIYGHKKNFKKIN